MCSVLKVSTSGYYAWLDRKPSARSLESDRLKHKIERIYNDSKGRYGSPRICKELIAEGEQVSRQRVARMMRQEGLRSIINKKYRISTTDSKHNYPIAENLLKRNFTVAAPAKVWVSDITYIRTAQGWLYLTIIMDLFDRKIIGWSLSTTMLTTATVIPAWSMAIKNRSITEGLIFHSDRGVQYASNEFRSILRINEVKQSMSRKGDCWDNAVAESFFKSLKSELVNHQHYKSILDAKNDLFEFIEIWYNRKRRHSFLGYLTPEEYGKKNLLNAA